MNWTDLRVNVVKKESMDASASTPVVGTTVYFDLFDKGYYQIFSATEVTNSKGVAILFGENYTAKTPVNLYSAEYWDAYILYNGKGIPTGMMPISEQNGTITIIESSANTWNELCVYVGRKDGGDTFPVVDNLVYFHLGRKLDARITILSGLTNKLGYAFAINDGSYNDFDLWSATTTYNNGIYYSDSYELPTEKGEIIFSGGEKQSIHRLAIFTEYQKKPITAYVSTFIYSQDGSKYYRLTGNTEISNDKARIDFNIDGIPPEYQDIGYVKLNAYNDEGSLSFIGQNQMFPYLDPNEGYCLTVGLSSQALYYGEIIGKVNSCDMLYYYISNGGKLGVNPWDLSIKKESGGAAIIYNSEPTSAYPSSTSYPTTFASDTPYMKFYSYPSDQTYGSNYTNVNLIDYVFDNNAHQITDVFIYCPKISTLKIENPVVLDTVQYDLDSPVYNLPDVTITYNYITGGSVVWTTTSSSNDQFTIFNLSNIPGGAEMFLRTLAGRTSNRVERILSKKHYVDNITYAFISASTAPTSVHQVLPYNGHFLYFCKYIMNGGQTTLFSLPQRYVHIEREEDICYTADMFNDYVQGFDYVYDGNVVTATTATPVDDMVLSSGNYPGVSAFTILPSNKLIVATHGFYESCATETEPQMLPPTSVTDYKTFFVNEAISRPEYYTIYANKPHETLSSNDDYFDPNNASYYGHAYNEHMESFWPIEGKHYNYLEFFTTGNTTGSVKLEAVNIQPNDIIDTLEYSYWGDRWAHYEIGDEIELYPGTNVRFRNRDNVTEFSIGIENQIEKYYNFVVEGNKMCVKGNLSSLINVSGMGRTVTGEYSFLKLFYGSLIYNAEELKIDPLTASTGCYYRMFEGCENLRKGPKTISAVSGENACMGHMFNGCTAMTNGPLRIRLREYRYLCCNHMFFNCTSLKYPPLFTFNITENVFGQECFGRMFENCTSLETPTLNPDEYYIIHDDPQRDGYGCAWQLGDTRGRLEVGEGSCYAMFKNCIKLQSTPLFKPYNIGKQGCTEMFYRCGLLTDVDFSMPFDSSVVSTGGCSYMFYSCTSITNLSGVALSATSLSELCYYHMFDECYKLCENLPYIKAQIIPTSGCAYMYHKCYCQTNNILKPINQFVTTDLLRVEEYGMSHMFDECKYMDINIGKREMFYNNNKLTFKSSKSSISNVYDAFIEKPSSNNYAFYGDLWVKLNSEDGPENVGKVDLIGPYFEEKWNLPVNYEFIYKYNEIYLNATTLRTGCYSWMFANCDNLHYASHIVLNANVLADLCYDHMFYSCDRLFSIPLSLSGVTAFSESGCQYMFAYDGDYTGNNNIKNQTNYKEDSNFNYVFRVFSGYDLEYYIYKEGLRNVQMYYNYYYDILGNFYWPLNLENNHPYFSNADSEGLNYSGRTRLSYCLVDVSDKITAFSNNIILHGGAPSFTNARNCFNHMFFGCKGMKKVNMNFTNSFIKDSMFESMFNCCYSLLKPPTFSLNQADNNNSVGDRGCLNMFKSCHELLTLGCAYDILSATTIGDNAYNSMYLGCYKIFVGPEIKALSMGTGAMARMFEDCYRLLQLGYVDSELSILPSTTLNTNCYHGMFANCFSLVTAPKLPAQQLSAGCYSWMFASACLWYYTGHCSYTIYSKLYSQESLDVPVTANGRCTLSNFEPYEDTVFNYNDDYDLDYTYFGNYFYGMTYDIMGTQGLNNGYFMDPGFIRETPYRNLDTKRYLREETDITGDTYYAPTKGTTSEYFDSLSTYYSTSGYKSRSIVSKVHDTHYRRIGTSWPNNMFLYICSAIPGVNSSGYIGLEKDSNGFWNEKFKLTDIQNSNIDVTYKKNNGNSYIYATASIPCLIDEGDISALNSQLDAYNNDIKKKYVKYCLRARYRITAITQNEVSEGYSLNYNSNEYYKINKKVRRRSLWASYATDLNDFYIPVNDRCQWGLGLSKIVVSANTINATYCEGWANMLNLCDDGKIYIPNGSTIVNGANGKPDGWDLIRT